MARPEKKRNIRCNPAAYYFKPKSIPMSDLEEIFLAPDELEAIRLADLSGLFQEDAALKMNISRATFGRIVSRARNKVAEAILLGKAIRISQNLPEAIKNKANRICSNCGKNFITSPRKKFCSKCLSIIKE